MKAGDLNRRVDLWRYAKIGVSAFNEDIYAWGAAMTGIPAAVKALTADERFGSGQVFAVRTLTFTTRWFAGLANEDVIAFDGENFDIAGIAEIGRRVGYEITATWREGALEDVP